MSRSCYTAVVSAAFTALQKVGPDTLATPKSLC